MTDRAIPHGFAAAFIALPVVGLLFFSVPWETDPRAEKPEVRYQRLKNPYSAFLASFAYLGSEHSVETTREYVTTRESVPDWDGLFPWERAELASLSHQREAKPGKDDVDRIDDDSFEYSESPRSVGGFECTGLSKVECVDRVVLRTGLNTNEMRFEDETTALGAMVAIQDLERTKALLAGGANPNLLDGHNRRPLRILIEECKSGLARRAVQSCTAHYGPNSSLCSDQESAVKKAIVEDEKLLPLFEVLSAAGASTARKIPGRDVLINGVSDADKDISTMAYARLSCSEFIVKALSAGRPGAK